MWNLVDEGVAKVYAITMHPGTKKGDTNQKH